MKQLESSEFGTKGEFVLIVSAFEKELEEGFSEKVFLLSRVMIFFY